MEELSSAKDEAEQEQQKASDALTSAQSAQAQMAARAQSEDAAEAEAARKAAEEAAATTAQMQQQGSVSNSNGSTRAAMPEVLEALALVLRLSSPRYRRFFFWHYVHEQLEIRRRFVLRHRRWLYGWHDRVWCHCYRVFDGRSHAQRALGTMSRSAMVDVPLSLWSMTVARMSMAV